MFSYDDYLSNIYNVSLYNSFNNLLKYYFNDSIEDITVNNAFYNLTSIVNYIDKITFNDDMLDDYYRERSKKNLSDILSKKISSDKVNLITSICNGLNIEKHIKFSNKDHFINPLKNENVGKAIHTLNEVITRFFKETYDEYLKKRLFYNEIPYVFIYNYIDDYSMYKDAFKENIDLCNSPFFIVKITIRMVDEDERLDNYLTIPVLVFPFLNKLVTIMISFCNKRLIYVVDYPFDIKILSKGFNSLSSISEGIDKLLNESIDLFLNSNPFYMTNILKEYNIEDYNVYFGNIIYDKVCGFLRENGASRHLITTRDKDIFWLDKLFSLEKDKYEETDLYKEVINYEKKNIKDYNENYYSWIDHFYTEDGMANIDNLFKDINKILNTNKTVEPLVSYIKEEKYKEEA